MLILLRATFTLIPAHATDMLELAWILYQRYEAVRLLSIGSIYDARKEQVAIREGYISSNLVVMMQGR